MDEKHALEGHRRAIEEHIGKYERYKIEAPHSLRVTLATIENIQKQIKDIRARHPHWPANDRLDYWRP